MKIKFVPNWKKSFRWFSVQVPTVNGAIIATWTQLPAKFQDAYPVSWLLATVLFLLVLGVYGRLVDQTPKADPAP